MLLRINNECICLFDVNLFMVVCTVTYSIHFADRNQMAVSNVGSKHTTLQWYSRPQRLSFPCLACIPMDNFKRRRYVKNRNQVLESCRPGELRLSSIQVRRPFGSLVLLELIASWQ
jgi:hypothetical protein